ncbi:class I SAM-dependent methyltransferase [Lacisediminihabitans sp.]|uniref:class I SAM-dependent methyltransferase n=1 Tax=Lacisediminihabitans sp. TaxID=2787631 RepID=UPI00374DACF9
MTGDITTAITPGIGATSYWQPNHLVPSAWREHAPFAFWLVAATRPQTIVELGTHNGYSFFVFAEAAKRLGLDTRLFAIDTWQGDDQAGLYGEDVYQSVARIAQENYPLSTELVRSYFGEAVARFDDGSIDLLHIDGRHGYEDVREDFEAYRAKLSPRAVVVFHDTQEFQPTFGVHRYWKELSEQAPSFEFHHGHGLGVLAYGPDAPAEVRELIQHGADDPQPIRDFYQARGAEISRRADDSDRLIAFELETANLRRELAAYGHELEVSRAHLEHVLASTSWKFTAPLRRITGLFTKAQ